jgi:hypothetical protein
MNKIFELSGIEGYPEIISQIIQISQVMDISLLDTKSYAFTVALENQQCLNISGIYDDTDAMEVCREVHRLRNQLLAEVLRSNPGFLTISNETYGSFPAGEQFCQFPNQTIKENT